MPRIFLLNFKSNSLRRSTCALNDTKMRKRQTWTPKINKQEWRSKQRNERKMKRSVLKEMLSLRRKKLKTIKNWDISYKQVCVCEFNGFSFAQSAFALWATRLSNIRIHFVFMRFRSSAITNDIHSCRSERRQDALKCSDALFLYLWPPCSGFIGLNKRNENLFT